MRFTKKPVLPKFGAITSVLGLVRADRKNPPKRPSRKPKALRVKIAYARAQIKRKLAAREISAARESEISKALRGARSRRKKNKSSNTK